MDTSPCSASPTPVRTPADRRAFTLVEMIVVMSIIVILLAATGPMMRGILGGRNIGDNVDAISGYLAYARTQAITQNTYVVVGFYQASGSDDLQMAGVVSANGTFDPNSFKPVATVVSPAANYPLLGKTIHLSNVTLVPKTSLSSQLQTKVPTPDGTTLVECSASPNYTTNPSHFSLLIGSQSFPYCIIAFSPQGEALFFPDDPQKTGGTTNVSANLPFYSQLFIGLRATRNGTVNTNDINSAAILLDGGSGDIKVFRL